MPDPKKLATAILKARGTKGYDALITRTFEAFSIKKKDEAELAWKILELRAYMATAITNGNVARVLELVPKEGAAWPLVSAAQEGQLDVLRAVLASKAKRTPVDLSKALYYGIQGSEAVVTLLLEHGADPNLYADGSFDSVLAFAQKTNRTKIAALLKKAGAKLRIQKK